MGKSNGEPRRVIDSSHQVPLPPSIPRQMKCSTLGTDIIPSQRTPTSSLPGEDITAPQGYKACGDGYTARFDNLVEDIKNKTKCVDDTLIWSADIEQAFNDAVLWQWYHPQPGQISIRTRHSAIRWFRNQHVHPSSTTDVRSWFGLVNQVAYTFSRATTMAQTCCNHPRNSLGPQNTESKQIIRSTRVWRFLRRTGLHA